MIELKGLGGKRKLLIENHIDFIAALEKEGNNVFSAFVEIRNGTAYFAVVLNK